MQVLGRLAYGPALALQERCHAAVLAGADDSLLLVEHPPVVTLGRNGGAQNLLRGPAELAAAGIELVETGRGGDVTYHGPGQLVVYPILQLQPEEQDIRAYVTRLEEIILRTAADFGVIAERQAGLRGIWVGQNKLAAIGVRLVRWATLHGFALNVSGELAGFEHIVACGLHGRGVTSLARLAAAAPAWDVVQARIVHHAGAVLARTTYFSESQGEGT